MLLYKHPAIDHPDFSAYVQRRPGPDDPGRSRDFVLVRLNGLPDPP